MKEVERVLDVALSVGEGIIRAGGEVSRAEDSVSRICSAFGMKRCDVFAISTYITISIESGEGESAVKSRRIRGRITDLKKLECINSLSRDICSGLVDISSAELCLSCIDTDQRRNTLKNYAVSMAVCGTFTLFFGGGIKEAVASILAAGIMVFLKRTAKNGFGNAVIFTFVCSFLGGLIGAFLVRCGFADDYSVIAKGDIMLLVPGVSLVCAGRDLISGELLTGVLELIEALLIAVALAAGFALPESFLNLV